MEKEETLSIEDLPSELLFNEILARSSISDALAFCNVDRSLKTLCSYQNVWLALFGKYNLVQKQEVLKEWAYSGLMIDMLVKVVSVLPGVEDATLEIVYLYLLEQDPLIRERYPIFSAFKSDDEYFGPLREFMALFRRSGDRETQLLSTDAFQRLLESPVATLPDYYSDLLVNSLRVEEVEVLLSPDYFERE